MAGFSLPESQELEQFLKFEALESCANNITRTYVLVRENKVTAYVTLLCASIDIAPGAVQRPDVRGEYKAFPALKIARLAVDCNHQRRGHGKLLIKLAIALAKEVMRLVGCRFVMLDAKRTAQAFYEQMGFEVLAGKTATRIHPIMFLDLAKAESECQGEAERNFTGAASA